MTLKRRCAAPSRALLVASALLLAVLSACGSDATPTPLPTVDLDGGRTSSLATRRSRGGDIAASGVVVPAGEAELSFATAGIVTTVGPSVGDSVEEGQVLALMESVDLRAALDEAQRNLDELESPAAIASAVKAVAMARQDADEAQEGVDRLSLPHGSAATIKNLEARVDLALQELDEATADYEAVQDRADSDPGKIAALVAKTQAQLNLDNLEDTYLQNVSRPSKAEADAARADLDAAEAALQEAEWYVDALQGESVPEDATGSDLSRLARVRDDLKRAQDRLDATRLISPIDGTVTVVGIAEGEFATPGQVVMVVADLSDLRIETTDLSERDVPEVEIGQAVTVFVDALDRELSGVVGAISPVADTLGGDVVYKLTVELDSRPDGLRPGMSADVDVDTSQ